MRFIEKMEQNGRNFNFMQSNTFGSYRVFDSLKCADRHQFKEFGTRTNIALENAA